MDTHDRLTLSVTEAAQVLAPATFEVADIAPGQSGGGGGNRTRVQGFADLCLSHSATPPHQRGYRPTRPRLSTMACHNVPFPG